MFCRRSSTKSVSCMVTEKVQGEDLGEGNFFFSRLTSEAHPCQLEFFGQVFLSRWISSTVFAGPGRNAAGKIAQDCAKNHCTRLPERHKEC